jgi:hypothetical protein
MGKMGLTPNFRPPTGDGEVAFRLSHAGGVLIWPL